MLLVVQSMLVVGVDVALFDRTQSALSGTVLTHEQKCSTNTKHFKIIQ